MIDGFAEKYCGCFRAVQFQELVKALNISYGKRRKTREHTFDRSTALAASLRRFGAGDPFSFHKRGYLRTIHAVTAPIRQKVYYVFAESSQNDRRARQGNDRDQRLHRLFIDEAHEFKNLFLYTKMRNVAGIGQTNAEKSTDLYNKCQYLDEITGGKGTIFATGTPISNTMSELYTMMRYLQSSTLSKMKMQNFDAWAANFGEAVTAIELAPEGTGYRSKTRFSRFFNLPELMNIFKEAADIKMSDQLNLDVPTAHFHNIAVLPNELQKEMVQELSKRAAAVHNKMVAPEVDNMPKITGDGRKIGLDQRLMNPNLPDNPDSKVNICVKNVFDIYTKTAEKKSTQIIFCDFSTPSGKKFNLYDDIRDKLIAKGVAKEEIAFIHDADNEVKKKELFAKIRSGKVRVLLGSTAKCGAGMNVQDKLVAIHHLDCPWRPSDLEQREGRIIRQGNENKDVDIFRAPGLREEFRGRKQQRKQPQRLRKKDDQQRLRGV